MVPRSRQTPAGAGVYRLSKDGSDYGVLHSFGSGTDGAFPNTGLVLGSDGAFYGTTSGDGYPGGTVFKFWPPQTPEVMGVVGTNSSVQVTVSGLGNYQYQILRSTDLITWAALTNVTMPSNGQYTHIDDTPATPVVFYRAAWVP